MTVWIKQGVCGDLSFQMQKARGELAVLYASHGNDFYITSIREGNHSPGSYHYIGQALDFKRQKMLKGELVDKLFGLTTRIGGKFDVIEYSDERDIFHVEFDPI